MNTYEILVNDTRHMTVRSYTFCDYSEAIDFYCAEKRAIEQFGRNSGLTVSRPIQAI